jgi:NADH-quinone oxidoreductase subunit G
MAENIKITIDGSEVEVPAGKNLLQVCLDHGMLIPHFCYHEALGSAGACRLCAAMVAPASDKPARLEMTCMLRASAGMVVNVNDEYAKRFRKTLIEELMLNHPHDCPVCDEGGECMLQDMTVLSEHQHRRTRFPKRTWKNQYLGPLIHHEMNRCITCYRCVRYYREYALGDDLGVFGSRDRVYFGRVNDGTFESEFSGNVVDVCPTGVFTNKRFREVYSRPWDLQTAPSVCVNCSVGCNVLPGVRHNLLRRIKPLKNDEVNQFFMCDRGRYGGEFVNSLARLKTARVDGRETMVEEAIEDIATRLAEIASKHGSGSIAAIGSTHASLEANAALMLLVKALGGEKVAFFRNSRERAAIRRAAQITVESKFAAPGMPEIEKADFVLNVGGDLTGEAPMLDLSVRQAIKAHQNYFEISPRAGKLEQFARASLRVAPVEEAEILQKIGQAGGKTEAGGTSQNFVSGVAEALASAKNPVILCSTLHDDPELVEAAFQLAKAASTEARKCGLAYYYPEANSVGDALAKNDADIESIWADIQSGKIKALVVLE